MKTKQNMTGSPEFMKELVVYEIPIKGFTSPKGPESGTFRSLEEKLDYLKELGITGIWLTGHQLCDPKHFYNIWTEYACIDPGVLDPTLGTEEDFKALIDSAHKRGIRIFLDVITHGVMQDSPLVKEHPQWFRGGSWGMTDYDWYGNHPDLDKWWVDTWVRYVTEFGVDGYRLDVAHYRNELWAEIRKQCREAGHEIMIMLESGPAITGVSDVLQSGIRLSDNHHRFPGSRMLWDLAGDMTDVCSRRNERYHYEIIFEDGEVQASWERPANVHEFIGDGLQVTEENSESIWKEENGTAYVEQRRIVRLENVRPGKAVKDVVVYDQDGHHWHSNREMSLMVDYDVQVKRDGTSMEISFPYRQQAGQYVSIQLSCHDNGWEGTEETEEAYAARGSRYFMGYGCLLAPGIPVFMAGEEFHADYVPIPWHAPDLYGKGEPGKGKWLYGSWIQWDQISQPEKKDMLEDTRRMLEIRRGFSKLIRPVQMEGADNPVLKALSFTSEKLLPKPYLYLGEQEAILVAANPDSQEEAVLNIGLSDALGMKKEAIGYEVLFGAAENGEGTAEELDQKLWKIGADQKARGGLLVVHFTW
ncbi:MAG: alpha-amylase family glycosyl hydrolase [Candidatus Limivivens sp.]|nr:alpha-amylase family glycosyl hydrolase [Candidatus Limivivens sp.]